MSPQRLLLAVGLPAGLLVALLLPPWTGYDEFSHYSRAVDIASGSILPEESARGTGSLIPAAYTEGTDLVILNYRAGRNPINWDHVRDLMELRPDGREVFVDTRATSASTPVAYLPAVAGMAIPVAAKAPGIVVLWGGRLASLAAYLALAWTAVRTAARFRWTLTIAALVPLNLTLAGSVSPDGLTIAAILAMVSIWTRVEDGEDPPLGWVAGVFLLLALAKPPYFLALAVFPASLLAGRTPARLRSVGWATGALAVGLVSSLINSSRNYRAVTFSLIGRSDYQPEVQAGRLLGDLPGFVFDAAQTWFLEISDYVPEWFRQLGSWESGLPAGLAWALLAVMVVAAAHLDSPDYLRSTGFTRGLVGIGTVGMLFVLYGSSYVYFSDRTDYQGIGIQMARYSVPLTALALIGWVPRWLVARLPAQQAGSEKAAAGSVALAVGVALVFSVVTWLVTGDEIPFG